jgi:hypothetical protein
MSARTAATCWPASGRSRSNAAWWRPADPLTRVSIHMVNTGNLAVATRADAGRRGALRRQPPRSPGCRAPRRRSPSTSSTPPARCANRCCRPAHARSHRRHRGQLRRQRHAGGGGGGAGARQDRLRVAGGARRRSRLQGTAGETAAGRRCADGPGRRQPQGGAQDGADRPACRPAATCARAASSRTAVTARSACSAPSASPPPASCQARWPKASPPSRRLAPRAVGRASERRIHRHAGSVGVGRELSRRPLRHPAHRACADARAGAGAAARSGTGTSGARSAPHGLQQRIQPRKYPPRVARIHALRSASLSCSAST